MHVKDEVATFAGGSSGTGKETARHLVAHGASILIGATDEAKLQPAAAGSGATGAAPVESAERHFGGLDKFDSGTRWPSFTTQGGGR